MDPANVAPLMPLLAAAVAVAAGATLLSTPVARRIAIRFGVLDAPSDRKLHGEPVPYLGGLGVVSGVIAGGAALYFGWLPFEVAVNLDVVGPLLIAVLALTALGLVDDLRGVSPRLRLVGELAVALGFLLWAGTFDVVRLGGLEFGQWPAGVTIAAAAFWMLSLTNAGNMMDGMDGLASGVGAIAAAVLSYLALVVYGRPGIGMFLAVVAGAYTAFLWFNRHPARIYLGDAGSLALGFALGAGALYGTTDASGVWHLAPALLVLGVPATDLLLAVLRRGLSSVRIDRTEGAAERFVFRVVQAPRFFEGDRGHLHHRLLDRFRSVPRAVWTLYAAAAVLGGFGVWAAHEPSSAPMLVVGSVLLGLMAVSRFLHPELRVFEKGFLLPLFHTREIGNRKLHFAYDAVIFAVAFVAAGWIGSRWWPATALDAVRVSLAALTGPTVMAVLGLYRIHFRRAGVWSLWKSASAVGAGAGAVLLVDTLVVQMPFASASGLLFVYLTLTGAVVPRAGYGFMDDAYARRPLQGRRALIHGTGRSEVAFLHRALSNETLDVRPVGFLDDDPGLAGKMIHGFPVYRADGGEVAGLIRSLGVELIALVGEPEGDSRELRLHLTTRAAGATLLWYRESVVESDGTGRARERPDAAAAEVRTPPPGRRSRSG